ncbi:MAG: chromosome segregation protein SMC [Candidatus Dormibacteraeota bacterium]|nr:chromosome segregation protein SMC [Candidatus Dormibacteraeota bacterium]
MRLRRLVLYGFKTFASRSEVAFDRGITAIVGPNGSGKSNLVDAVRWALGETNARELRGQRMDEVVYNGGGRRSRVNLAEVELLIDNEEGRLALDAPEVSVSRRVVRGAHDTEFRINGDRARLRDLERLLGGTGLTQNGYAVVAQNDIDSIIEATPAQRRVLVEQAAGVRALRAACEDVLSRVSRAEAVVRRLDDLLEEAEPRLAELDEQRVAAIEQRQLTVRLTELRGSLAREEWRAARGRLRQARRRLEHAGDRRDAAAEADSAFAERAAHERGRLQRARSLRDQAASRLEAARVAVERADGETRRLRDRVQRAVLQHTLHLQELDAARADVLALEASVTSEVAPRAAIEAAEARLAARSRAAAQQAEALDDARHAFEEAERREAAAQAHAGELSARARRLQMQRELLNEELGRRQDAAAAAGVAVERLRPGVDEAAEEAAAAAALAATAEARRVAHLAAVDAAWTAVNDADGAVADAAAVARSALAESARLRGAIAGAFGDGGIGRAVAEGRLQARRLSETFTVARADDETAVAAALEHHLGAWIVSDVARAAAHLDPEGAREEVLDAASQAGASAGSGLPGRSVVDAIDAAPDDLRLLGLLLGTTRLVSDEAEAALALAEGADAAVLPDGRVMGPAGLRGGGRPGRVLQLAAEGREASATADRAAEREARAIAAAAEAREQLASAEAAAADAARDAADAQAAKAAAASARREREAALAAAITQHRTVLEAAAQIEARLMAGGAEEERQQAAVARAEAEVGEATARRGAAEAALTAVRDDLASARRDVRDAEDDLERLKDTAPARTREEITRLLGGARRRIATLELRLHDAESEALAAVIAERPLRRRRHDLEAAVAEARDQLDTGGVPIAELERIVLGLEAEHAEVAVALARAQDEHAAAAAEVEGAEGEVDRLVDEARDDDDGSEWDPAAAERAEREIVRLERRVSGLGAVNALAPEQFELLQRRVLSLREQRADIGDACADLRRMARHLAADLERRFDAVFGAVSVHFQELFGELFPGGRATLRLEEQVLDEDTEDEAEAVAERRPGVEILAQLPGKRLCPLRLLSGGERALTALATVLALQAVNPSPFYIFDEVDAALDDSNVLRFTRLLRRLSQDQQFLVVTHNHITMAAADVLWGVTIDGDGTSSVLGVRFDSSAPAELAFASALRPDERRAAG